MEAFTTYIMDENNLLATICITGVAATIIAALIWRTSSDSKKGRKKRKIKKGSKVAKPIPLTLEEKIQKVLTTYNTQYKGEISQLLENFNPSEEKEVYQKNYFNEMLLKLLIELDGVDLMDIEGERKAILKQNRKDAVKLIQGQLNKLDKLV